MQRESPPETTTELTEREQEILKLLATGCSNKEIAQKLLISSNTVKVHLRNIFAKIGAASRTEAAMYAVKVGLVKSPAVSKPASEVSDAAETAPFEPTRPNPFLRPASIAAIVIVLVAVLSMGIFLTRQYFPTAASTSKTTPTAISRWKTLASLPIARSGLAVGEYNNQIYAIGGESSQGVTGTVERYDPKTNQWAELSPKPRPVTDVTAAVVGGKIYIPGGRLASGEVTNVLEIYSPRLNSWEEGNRLPVAMSAYALAVFEGRLYLFGGWDGKQFLKSVFIYDPAQDRWDELAPMQEARGYAGAAVAGDKIYVMGGYDGKQALKNNDVFSPSPDDSKSPWGQAATLPEGRYAFGIASIADIVTLIGGKGQGGSALPPLQYIHQQDLWQPFKAPFSQIWSNLGIVPLQTQLYAIGGSLGGAPADQNLSYQAIYLISIP